MDFETPISLSAEVGWSFFIAVGIVYAVQGVKAILGYRNWATRIPGWVWVAIALVISIGVCWGFKADQVGRLFAEAQIDLAPPWSYIATGLAIGFSSNVVFAVKKPIKKRLDGKKEENEEATEETHEEVSCEIPAPVVPMPPVVYEEQHPVRSGKAQILLQVDYPEAGPNYFVWTGEELLAVEKVSTK